MSDSPAPNAGGPDSNCTMKEPTLPARCRACGAVLDAGRLVGLCPACTWREIMDVQPEDPEPASSIVEHSLLQIPGHVVMGEIARGGMGVVYRAEQTEPKRTVALKMLSPSQIASKDMRARFRLEARAIATLDHPAILPVYQVGEQDGLPFFTMKFAGGGTLAARIPQFRSRFVRIVELLATLADAVQFAHDHGVLHRDLKPGNILFDETGRPYVSDFGLAKLADNNADLTRSLHLLGTPHYIAPEVAARSARSATTASDIYSLGAILYELLTGHPPFEAEAIPALLRQIAEDEPVPPSERAKSDDRNPGSGTNPKLKHGNFKSRGAGKVGGFGSAIYNRLRISDFGFGISGRANPPPPALPVVPRDLEVICLKCLAKDTSRRYGSARELAEDLRRWLAGRPILARSTTQRERLIMWVRRNPTISALVSLLVLVFSFGGFMLARSNLRLSEALEDSLLSQARSERTSGQAGQRLKALELVRRAADLLPMHQSRAQERRVALRSEAAGALGLPDLRLTESWPVHVAHFESAPEFTDDLARYAASAPEGGFSLFATSTHQELRHFPGAASNPALGFKFSQDGQWIAASFQDGSAVVHSLGSDRPALVFAGSATARVEVEFLPDCQRLLVGGPARGVERWELTTGAHHALVARPETRLGLKVAPGGERFASIGPEVLEIRSVSDGARSWFLPLTNGASALAWSPDERFLAWAQANQPFETTVVDLSSSQVVAHFQDHELRVNRLAFHPDGQSLMSVGWDGRMAWHQLPSGGIRLMAQAGPRVLHFSRDGQHLGFEPGHGQAGVLEVKPSPVFYSWGRASPQDDEACMVNCSADGRLVATASIRGIQVWDTALRAEIAHLPLPKVVEFAIVLFHPDSQSLYYCATGLGIAKVEIKRGPTQAGSRTAVELGTPCGLGAANGYMLQEFAPDQRSLVIGEPLVEEGPLRSRFWIWPEADPARARALAAGVPMVGYHLTGDGRWGTTAHLTEPDVWIWDPASARPVRSLGIPETANVLPSPDGHWLLVTTRQHHQLWETGSWRPGPSWSMHSLQRGNWAAAFSRDGRWLATQGLEGRIEIRSLPEAQLQLELPPPIPLRLHDLSFSPDGTRLYLLQGTGRLFEWDLARLKQELREFGLDWRP